LGSPASAFSDGVEIAVVVENHEILQFCGSCYQQVDWPGCAMRAPSGEHTLDFLGTLEYLPRHGRVDEGPLQQLDEFITLRLRPSRVKELELNDWADCYQSRGDRLLPPSPYVTSSEDPNKSARIDEVPGEHSVSGVCKKLVKRAGLTKLAKSGESAGPAKALGSFPKRRVDGVLLRRGAEEVSGFLECSIVDVNEDLRHDNLLIYRIPGQYIHGSARGAAQARRWFLPYVTGQ
jgi:hypothetical protein